MLLLYLCFLVWTWWTKKHLLNQKMVPFWNPFQLFPIFLGRFRISQTRGDRWNFFMPLLPHKFKSAKVIQNDSERICTPENWRLEPEHTFLEKTNHLPFTSNLWVSAVRFREVFFYFVISIVFPRRNHSTRQIPENLAAYWIEHDFDWTTSHPNFSSPFLFSIWHLRHCYRAAQNKKKIKQAQSAKSISVPLTPMRRCRGQTCWPSKRPWPIAFLIFVLAEVKLQPNLLQRFSMHFRESAFPAASKTQSLYEINSGKTTILCNFLDWIREVFLNKSSFWQVLGAGVVTWNVFLSILGHQEYAKAVASTLPQDLKKKCHYISMGFYQKATLMKIWVADKIIGWTE